MRFLHWLYSSPRTLWEFVRFGLVYASHGLALGLAMAFLPQWLIFSLILAALAYFVWQAWPFAVPRRCYDCGNKQKVLPMFRVTPGPWRPWRRRQEVRWLCPPHWVRDMQWQVIQQANKGNKDRPGG